MSSDISLGICISNSDPFNHGRIRYVPYEAYKEYDSVESILNTISSLNIASSVYDEWSYASTPPRQTDPFVAEPFLPNNLSIIPRVGQVTRLVRQSDGKMLFIGPVTSQPIFITDTYSEYKNKKKQVVNDDIANNPNNTVLSGNQGEQLIIGDNKVLMRLSHINEDNTIKEQYPLFQISRFIKNVKYKEETIIRTKTKDVFIDYVIELTFEYTKKTQKTDKNIKCVVALYDTQETIQDEKGKKGLVRGKYNPNSEYYDGASRNQYTVRHVLEFNDPQTLEKTIETIISSYNTKKIKFFNPELVGTQIVETINGNINLLNRLQLKPNNGGANNDTLETVPNLNNFVVRVKPSNKTLYNTPSTKLQNDLGIPSNQPTDIDSIEYARFYEFNEFIKLFKKFTKERWLGNQTTQPKETETIKTVSEVVDEKETTVNVMYSDKFLFLSSINSPDYLKDGNNGMPVDVVYKFLSSINNDGVKDYKTYGFIRGEKLMELINQMIDIVLSHGHSIGQVQNSISREAQEKLSNLKAQINEEIQGNNLNKTNGVINHNLRLN
jgi:hypothetical protein